MANYGSVGQPLQPQANGYNPQQPGMLGTSPFYSYNQPIMSNVPVHSPVTGLTGMADALINGYSQYLSDPNRMNQPMQLGSAAPSGLPALIGNVFAGGNQSNGSAPVPDPSASGVY